LLLLVLLTNVIYAAGPASGAVFFIEISLSPSTVNTYMDAPGAEVAVTVTNTDPINAHTITLTLTRGVRWERIGYFSPNTITLPPGGSAPSILTVLIRSADVCPYTNFPGAYSETFVVEAREAGVTVGSQNLVANVMYVGPPITISLDPSKSSYIIGEEVSLRMTSNVPAQYSLKIKKPDGSTWASAQGFLPATYTKKASEPTGTYTAELVAYYCGSAYDSDSFSIAPDTYDVTVSVVGLPSDLKTTLQVDGSKVAEMKGGDVRVLSYTIGTSHTFQVDQYVSGASGYRYYCTSNSWTAGAEGSNQFNYATQVYLDVSTDPTGITDVTQPGWYAAGSSASISSVPDELDGPPGVKYKFAEWTVDGTARAGNGFVVVMDAPHKVIAKFDTNFKLTVISDYGNPQGSGYYKAGETATFSVDSPVGIGIQQVFVQWKGDYSGKDPKASVTMDGPKTVTAVWTTSYFQLYLIMGAIAAVVVIVSLLLWRRSRAAPSAMKQPPPSPTPETSEAAAETAATTERAGTTPKPAVSIALRCTNCGRELQKDQIYCPECGQKRID